ncbi:lamin tail domain-containing protein [Streptomyces sp. NPDC052107]|uniref:lamin tail domain-containing protein n=1 Tax=Streptomyces sp. NPDC052107 TaxID=3155632 RepID=UPI003442B79D
MSVSAYVPARRLAAAALAAAAAVGAAAPPASAADHGPRTCRERVQISEVRRYVPGPEHHFNRSLNREWVAITNTGHREANLDGWTLSDDDGRTYTFHHYRLEGRATVRIHTGIGRDSDTDLYQDRRNSVWDEDFDTATLRDDRGRLIDAVSWGVEGRHGGRCSGEGLHDAGCRLGGGRHDEDEHRH